MESQHRGTGVGALRVARGAAGVAALKVVVQQLGSQQFARKANGVAALGGTGVAATRATGVGAIGVAALGELAGSQQLVGKCSFCVASKSANRFCVFFSRCLFNAAGCVDPVGTDHRNCFADVCRGYSSS